MLARSPGFTAIAVLTLGLGIGANTAVFSIVNSVLLEPLPYPDAEELVVVWQDFTRRDGPLTEWASFDNLVDWRAGNEVFDAIFAIDGFRPTLTGVDAPETLAGASFSYEGFQVLGIEPILGRSFRPEEDTAAAAEFVVILGHSLWQRRFNGDEAVIGTTIALNGRPATVIGVMPADFAVPFGAGGDIFAPLRIDATNSCGRGCVTIRAVARMKDGVSLERAQSDMSTIAARLEEEYPGANQGVGLYLQPLLDTVVGPVRSGLLVLLGAVGLLLLIACANVAALTLVRATGRQSEVAIRVAMGATRTRLFQQMLTESLMLAIGGSIVGFLLALWGVNLLVRVVPGTVPRFQSVSVDSTALLFTLSVTVLTSLVFGLAPTLRASRPQLNESLKEGGRGASGGVLGERLRGSLVVAQVALALTLLIGGALLLRSFVALVNVDPGFDPANLLTQQVLLPSARYADGTAMISFVDRMRERVEELPGVEGAGVINTIPMGRANSDSGFLIEGRERAPGERAPVAWLRSVSPEYLDLMKMRLERGRWFGTADHDQAPLVVLINETAERRYWPAEDPVGGRITIDGSIWREVVGVVADTKHFGLDAEEQPALYFPYKQNPSPFMSLVVRTDGSPDRWVRQVQAAVWEIDADLAFSGVSSMREVISGTVAPQRLIMALLVAFAAAAALLAAIGLYGVISYSVGQRTREIGVRMALGAGTDDVMRLVVGRGMGLLLLGLTIGLAASLALARLLETLLFGVGAYDPLTFVSVPVGLSIVALVACWIPARRAARVDPISALRFE